MRIHFVLNHGDTPVSKLADVEIHFEEGLLAGLKLVGCSVWKPKKGELPTVLVPSRSYATASGVRYFELLRGSGASGLENEASEDRQAIRRFKEYVRTEFLKITELGYPEASVTWKEVAQ